MSLFKIIELEVPLAGKIIFDAFDDMYSSFSKALSMALKGYGNPSPRLDGPLNGEGETQFQEGPQRPPATAAPVARPLRPVSKGDASIKSAIDFRVERQRLLIVDTGERISNHPIPGIPVTNPNEVTIYYFPPWQLQQVLSQPPQFFQQLSRSGRVYFALDSQRSRSNNSIPNIQPRSKL